MAFATATASSQSPCFSLLDRHLGIYYTSWLERLGAIPLLVLPPVITACQAFCKYSGST